MTEKVTDGFWWCIHSEGLYRLLVRAAAGEDPDLLVAEAYANSDHDYVEGDG